MEFLIIIFYMMDLIPLSLACVPVKLDFTLFRTADHGNYNQLATEWHYVQHAHLARCHHGMLPDTISRPPPNIPHRHPQLLPKLQKINQNIKHTTYLNKFQ